MGCRANVLRAGGMTVGFKVCNNPAVVSMAAGFTMAPDGMGARVLVQPQFDI